MSACRRKHVPVLPSCCHPGVHESVVSPPLIRQHDVVNPKRAMPFGKIGAWGRGHRPVVVGRRQRANRRRQVRHKAQGTRYTHPASKLGKGTAATTLMACTVGAIISTGSPLQTARQRGCACMQVRHVSKRFAHGCARGRGLTESAVHCPNSYWNCNC